MTGLLMILQRNAPFESVEEAREPVLTLARELGAARVPGGMWTRLHGVVLPLDLETIELLLTEGQSGRAATAARPTHVIPLNGRAPSSGELGQLSLTVRPAADLPMKPPCSAGLRLILRLSEALFKSDADTILRLLGGCFDGAQADAGAIGPGAWVKELGTGWATAARRPGKDWLPAGATMIQSRTGSIVVAHREDPASESVPARDALVRVRDALKGTPVRPSDAAFRMAPVQAPQPESNSLPLGQPPPIPPTVAVPYTVPPSPPAVRPASNLASTIAGSSLPIPGRHPVEALPFGSTPSAAFVASLSTAGPAKPHSAVGETLPLGANLMAHMVPALPFDETGVAPAPVVTKQNEVADTLPLGANLLASIRPALPFNPAGSAPAPVVARSAPMPDFTLDSYASLCAELLVFPLSSADILRKYGIADDTVKLGLDQRWRDLFVTVPSLQVEWRSKVTTFCDWLRRGGR